MLRILALVIAAAWTGAALAQAAKPDLAKAQATAQQVCAACHAADGNSPTSANPRIAGQFSEYLHKQLMDFKPQAGKKAVRENPIMLGMVANLSEEDMRGLAAFYAGQKMKAGPAKDKTLAMKGQKLYRGGNAATGVAACSGCHGPDGAGMPSQYPRIGGQYAEYIELQLKAFKTGTRANDPNAMMRGVAARMSDDEIKAVSEYLAGLR
jgi:cytochrome c553